MARPARFFLTDVFGTRQYSGNQLATFLDCDTISDTEMQQIAKEINFSETTFIVNPTAGTTNFKVRIFTPEAEVDFAGHPCLGTAHVIREYFINEAIDSLTLDLKIGKIPIRFSSADNIIWMQQAQASFGEDLSIDDLTNVLTLADDAIDTRYPIAQISTGFPTVIVPLKSLSALKSITLDKQKYYTLLEKSWAKNILAFAPEPYHGSHSLAVRVFAKFFGVPEDAATGSGNGCLAAYLIKNQYFGADSVNIQVGQGYEINRPSTLHLRARFDGEGTDIAVGGAVFSVAEGSWHVQHTT